MARDSSDSVSARSDGSSADSAAAVPEGIQWPEHLKELSHPLRDPSDEATRDRARGDAWRILNGAFSLYLRVHAARMGSIGREDREDLAAEKSLDILRRIESGATDFSGRSPGEIASFISKAAKNALLDFLRKNSRRVEPADEDREKWDIGDGEGGHAVSAAVAPDIELERGEFVGALRGCAERLDSRSRLCWFFRVFYGMVSKNIAVHPRIRLKASHVDVILQRSRDAIRDCMNKAGFDTNDIPPGTFTELWRTFRLEGV